jgi:hypothetical protein
LFMHLTTKEKEMQTIIINNIAVYQDRATQIWIVRDRATGKEIAHESNKKDAVKVANRIK